MLEVRDTILWGQDYEATIFLGFNNDGGLVQFEAESAYTVKLPLDKSWMSDSTKIDSADVNGDGCGDLVFSEYAQSFSKDSFHVKIAINQGDGKTFLFAQDRYAEILSLEHSILRIIDVFDEIYSPSDGDSLNSYFAMDWNDANGDGRDDLHIFWKDNSDLYGSIALSGEVKDPRNEFRFSKVLDISVARYFWGDCQYPLSTLRTITEMVLVI